MKKADQAKTLVEECYKYLYHRKVGILPINIYSNYLKPGCFLPGFSIFKCNKYF